MNAPLAPTLDEPIDEATPVIDDLTIYDYLGVLNSGDERSTSGHVDLDLLESHGFDFTGNLFDRRYESRSVNCGAAMCAVHKVRSEQRSERGDVTPCDRTCNPLGSFSDFGRLFHGVARFSGQDTSG